jgi:PhnB protein
MTTRLNPYLHFRGEALEAMQFYQSVFGGELTHTTFGEYGMSDDPGDADKVMHSQLDIDGGLTLMAGDAPQGMEGQSGSSMTVSLSGDDESQLRRYWDGLVEGGTVSMPLEKAPWGDSFGMCEDRYGVPWMVNIAGSADQVTG